MRRRAGVSALLGAALALLQLLLLRCGGAGAAALRARPRERNERPIIGILSQECHFNKCHKFGSSYIAASYVKFLESAGARVVPIRLNLSDEEYDKLFHSINGVLFPGGGVDLRTSKYAKVAKIFYQKALEMDGHRHCKESLLRNHDVPCKVVIKIVSQNDDGSFHVPSVLQANDKGDYFPVWGTCLGHEELTYLTSGEILLANTKTNGFALPLNFTSAAKNSRLFKNFPADILHALATEPLTSNFHVWSLSMQNFTKNKKLRNFYNVLTTNTADQLEFVSTMEAYKYPVYGIQWHPEKNTYEWKNSSGIPHSPLAIRSAYYTAEFFISEARKSLHSFPTKEEEIKELIYNYTPTYTGTFSSFQQIYFFD